MVVSRARRSIRTKLLRKEEFAARMRKNPTPAEQALRDALHERGYRFRCQQILHGYIVDFYFAVPKLVIEVDGYHHFTPQGRANDKIRTAVLLRNGYSLIRFSNAQVLRRTEETVALIEKKLTSRSR